MSLEFNYLKNIIIQSFPDAKVDLMDLVGDNNHYYVKIVSINFQGKTLVQQHKMVYESLSGIIGNNLHALSIKTELP